VRAGALTSETRIYADLADNAFDLFSGFESASYPRESAVDLKWFTRILSVQAGMKAGD